MKTLSAIDTNATETESTPAVDSKQQPSTTTKKTKTHRVLMTYSQWGEQAALQAGRY